MPDRIDQAATVSVIVPVREDAAGCRGLLERLARQTIPPDRFDVIIGADGSPAGAIDQFETADRRVRVVHGPAETSYAARNRAAAASGRDVLAFCDTDCRPDPDWLRAGLDALQDADIVAGEVTFMGPPRPSVWTLLTVDNFLDQRRNALRARGVTANLFVRRRSFDRWGRFDASLASGGDFEFVGRAVAHGARLVYGPDAIVRHPTLDDADAFFRKVWRTNRWSAIRRRRSGEPPSASTIVGCLPLAGAIVTRRQSLRPITTLDRARLRSAGIDVTRSNEMAALATYYLVVSQVANVARLAGWLSAPPRPPAPPAEGDPAPRSESPASAR
jgi:GT2 family glycosyltransferase